MEVWTSRRGSCEEAVGVPVWDLVEGCKCTDNDEVHFSQSGVDLVYVLLIAVCIRFFRLHRLKTLVGLCTNSFMNYKSLSQYATQK